MEHVGRNNVDVSYERLSRPVQKLCPRYALQLDGLYAAHKASLHLGNSNRQAE
jgi:hypothetical protein